MKRRLRGGLLAVVGYLLSPLSWWNDLFINLPLAYVLAWPFALISQRLFAPMVILGYWLTNVLGMVLLHQGIAEAATRRPDSNRRRLGRDVLVGTGYTAVIALLAITGVLKPPAFLRPKPVGPLHFAREEIDIRVTSDPGRRRNVEVRGMYHFQNRSSNQVTASIFYPFPLDSVHAYPDSIALAGFEFTRRDSGVSFKVSLAPQVEDSFFVYYRQPLRGKQARYIVTTTRAWRRPIDRAWFRITVPASFQDVRLSYKPDWKRETDSAVMYSFARCGFYPNKDVIVTWR